jgi:hypothetical protein
MFSRNCYRTSLTLSKTKGVDYKSVIISIAAECPAITFAVRFVGFLFTHLVEVLVALTLPFEAPVDLLLQVWFEVHVGSQGQAAVGLGSCLLLLVV